MNTIWKNQLKCLQIFKTLKEKVLDFTKLLNTKKKRSTKELRYEKIYSSLLNISVGVKKRSSWQTLCLTPSQKFVEKSYIFYVFFYSVTTVADYLCRNVILTLMLQEMYCFIDKHYFVLNYLDTANKKRKRNS
jgi:hypothetical protein